MDLESLGMGRMDHFLTRTTHLREDVDVGTDSRGTFRKPIGFAHRGARADAPENTLEAFQLALELGATGLESDVWITADGEAVLDHDGVVRKGLRRIPIRRFDRNDLPRHIPTLTDLFRNCGTDYELSLDIKDPSVVREVIRSVRHADPQLEDRLWLCHGDIPTVAKWRDESPRCHLVHSRRDIPKQGAERHAAQLASAGIQVANFHHRAWSEGMVALYHRFGILAFGWDAQFEQTLNHLLRSGVDAVYSDHVERMVAALSH